MQEVYNFISSHYELIISGITLIISVVMFIIRKKPITDIYSQLYAWCIAAVNITEKTNLKGQDKLFYAKDIVFNFIKDKYPKLSADYYNHVISVIIEQILATPQKKGE